MPDPVEAIAMSNPDLKGAFARSLALSVEIALEGQRAARKGKRK